MELHLINDAGYEALQELAESEPQLFVAGNSAQLRGAAEDKAREVNGTDVEMYGEKLDLRASLEEMNRLMLEGPGSDAEYATMVRSALGTSLVQAASRLLWATINCFELPQYTPIRWRSSNLSQSVSTEFVELHWLRYSGSNGRKSNAAARLWWLAEMASRAAEFSEHSYHELLSAMAGNVNLYHQTIDRPYLSSNPRLLAAVYDVFLGGNDHLRTTKDASRLMMALNVRAATLSLDFLDYDELRDVVEEAKPPKDP